MYGAPINRKRRDERGDLGVDVEQRQQVETTVRDGQLVVADGAARDMQQLAFGEHDRTPVVSNSLRQASAAARSMVKSNDRSLRASARKYRRAALSACSVTSSSRVLTRAA
ncbi:MAG: hypothetical protein ACRDRU_03400 [Pseudonocardiaceae bacterium]